MSLVLSLFPGIGLLDMAFELEGFTVVRGPDLLWGGDVRRFHPPPGRFDGVIGRDALVGRVDRGAVVAAVYDLTAPGGRLSLAEAVPRRAARPSSLLGPAALPEDLAARVHAAEAAAYGEGDGPGDTSTAAPPWPQPERSLAEQKFPPPST